MRRSAAPWPASTLLSKKEVNLYLKHNIFISSLPPDAEKIARAVREHWGIEKTLH